MKLQENIPLAPYTTLGVGGRARYFIEVHTEADVEEAIAFAHEQKLSLFVLGNGSNVLVPDADVEGVVLRMLKSDISAEVDEESIIIIAGAGVPWEEVVDAASAQNVFGIENLAGIPGSLGGAAVQNIGAYGAEFSETFEYALVVDRTNGEKRRVMRAEAAFAYRTSFFKTHPELIITHVALRFSKSAQANIAYADLVRAQEAGVLLDTPSAIATAVRGIRANKFPRTSLEGTAGSFFKNPIVSRELGDSLALRHPGLPAYPQDDGAVKLSLAWVLDHALLLSGYAKGHVRLYEKQPIVLVVQSGATATEVDEFANEIAKKVFDATGITIEREVEMFGTQK